MQSLIFTLLISILAVNAQAGGNIPFRFIPKHSGACVTGPPSAFTWIGGTDANWNTNANWFGGTAPGVSDTAIFDGNCTANCSPTVNVAISVDGINVKCSYVGTITQGAGNTVTVGANGWKHRSGSFMGSDAAITLASALTVSGGTFNSTSASLTMTFNAASNTAKDMFIVSATGSFVHRNGTVVMNGIAQTCGNSTSRIYRISVPAASPLYNLTFAGVRDGCHGSEPIHLIEGTGLTVINTLFHENGWMASTTETNQILLSGNLDVSATADGTWSPGYGVKIVFTGAGAQDYSHLAGGTTGIIVIDKTGGSVTPTLGTTSLGASRFVLTQGSFTAPTGTMSLIDLEPGVNYAAFDIFKTTVGSTFVNNGGSVLLQGQPVRCGNSQNRIYNIDVPVGFSFQNLEINGGTDVCHGSLANHKILGAGFEVDGSLTLTNGFFDGPGTVTANGDVLINSTFDGGNAPLTFGGTAAQSYTVSGTHTTGNVIVNKAAGAVTMQRNVALPTSNLTVTAGTLDMWGSDLSITNTLTISSGATVVCNGGALSHGTLSNSGTLTCTAGTHVFTPVGSFASSSYNAASSSINVVSTAQLDAGNMGVLIVATDNLGTVNGTTNEHTTVSDSVGNIWKKKIEYSNASGAAASGATISIWTVRAITNLPVASSITVSFSGSLTASAVTGQQFSYTGPHAFTVDGSITSADVGIDPSPLSLSGLTSRPYLWIRATGAEDDGTAYTASTNYSAFTHTSSTTSGGVSATNIGARGEFRIFTGTGDTTDPGGAAADSANAYIAIP